MSSNNTNNAPEGNVYENKQILALGVVTSEEQLEALMEQEATLLFVMPDQEYTEHVRSCEDYLKAQVAADQIANGSEVLVIRVHDHAKIEFETAIKSLKPKTRKPRTKKEAEEPTPPPEVADEEPLETEEEV